MKQLITDLGLPLPFSPRYRHQRCLQEAGRAPEKVSPFRTLPAPREGTPHAAKKQGLQRIQGGHRQLG